MAISPSTYTHINRTAFRRTWIIFTIRAPAKSASKIYALFPISRKCCWQQSGVARTRAHMRGPACGKPLFLRPSAHTIKCVTAAGREKELSLSGRFSNRARELIAVDEAQTRHSNLWPETLTLRRCHRRSTHNLHTILVLWLASCELLEKKRVSEFSRGQKLLKFTQLLRAVVGNGKTLMALLDMFSSYYITTKF